MRAGERIAAGIASPNRDEARFPEADRFDITRSPNRHIAFGRGVHFCLEDNIALGSLLQRCRDTQVDTATALEAVPRTGVFDPRRLPVTFTPV